MRQYCKLSNLSSDTLKEIFCYFFSKCDKINIYFPNEAPEDIISFKEKFLNAIHIEKTAGELSSLEDDLDEKEGYSMIIASLTEEVKELIININDSFHLSLGLISGEKVLFYIGDEGECIIEDNENSEIFSSSLFNAFQVI